MEVVSFLFSLLGHLNSGKTGDFFAFVATARTVFDTDTKGKFAL
jgi:hypothetical protein